MIDGVASLVNSGCMSEQKRIQVSYGAGVTACHFTVVP